MRSININTKALQIVIETFNKKVKRWKYYLPMFNLILFIGVTSLAIICVLLVSYPQRNTIKSEKYGEEISLKKISLPPLLTDTKTINYYEPILSNNPFSPSRTRWNPPEIKMNSIPEEGIVQSVVNQQKPKGTPKKITLQGILIIGNTRKALIENPDKMNNNKPFIFIEEGEEIAEYKVKSIEPDQIKLDWYGEEQVIVMNSTIKK